MTTYETVVFLQGDEATEYLDLIDEHGAEVAAAQLRDNYGHLEPMISDREPWSKTDFEHWTPGLNEVMTYNPRIGYVALTYVNAQD